MISHMCYSNQYVLMMQLKASKDSSRSFQTSSEINFLINARKSLPTSGQIFNTTFLPKNFITKHNPLPPPPPRAAVALRQRSPSPVPYPLAKAQGPRPASRGPPPPLRPTRVTAPRHPPSSPRAAAPLLWHAAGASSMPRS